MTNNFECWSKYYHYLAGRHQRRQVRETWMLFQRALNLHTFEASSLCFTLSSISNNYNCNWSHLNNLLSIFLSVLLEMIMRKKYNISEMSRKVPWRASVKSDSHDALHTENLHCMQKCADTSHAMELFWCDNFISTEMFSVLMITVSQNVELCKVHKLRYTP